MAVTYGFYNSLNHDRVYNAEQMSAIFDGIITDGVFDNYGEIFATVPAASDLQVIVKTGRAWFDHTWTLSDSQIILNIEQADVSLKRIDAIVLEVNSSPSVRENSIKVIKGTPASTPEKPTLANTATLHQHPLAYVTINANAIDISASDIDIRVGKSDCPFVTSVLKSVSIDDLFNGWDEEFNTWFDNLKATMTENVVTNLQKQIDERVKISDKATTAEAEAGQDDTKWMTPAKTKSLIVATTTPAVGTIQYSARNLETETNGVYLFMDGRSLKKSSYPDLAKLVGYGYGYVPKYLSSKVTDESQSYIQDVWKTKSGHFIILEDVSGTFTRARDLGSGVVTKQNKGGGTVRIGDNVAYYIRRYDGKTRVSILKLDSTVTLSLDDKVINHSNNVSNSDEYWIVIDNKLYVLYVGNGKIERVIIDRNGTMNSTTVTATTSNWNSLIIAPPYIYGANNDRLDPRVPTIETGLMNNSISSLISQNINDETLDTLSISVYNPLYNETYIIQSNSWPRIGYAINAVTNTIKKIYIPMPDWWTSNTSTCFLDWMGRDELGYYLIGYHQKSSSDEMAEYYISREKNGVFLPAIKFISYTNYDRSQGGNIPYSVNTTNGRLETQDPQFFNIPKDSSYLGFIKEG